MLITIRIQTEINHLKTLSLKCLQLNNNSKNRTNEKQGKNRI